MRSNPEYMRERVYAGEQVLKWLPLPDCRRVRNMNKLKTNLLLRSLWPPLCLPSHGIRIRIFHLQGREESLPLKYEQWSYKNFQRIFQWQPAAQGFPLRSFCLLLGSRTGLDRRVCGQNLGGIWEYGFVVWWFLSRPRWWWIWKLNIFEVREISRPPAKLRTNISSKRNSTPFALSQLLLSRRAIDSAALWLRFNQ